MYTVYNNTFIMQNFYGEGESQWLEATADLIEDQEWQHMEVHKVLFPELATNKTGM